jgi:hypothetical protein
MVVPGHPPACETSAKPPRTAPLFIENAGHQSPELGRYAPAGFVLKDSFPQHTFQEQHVTNQPV